MTRTLSGNGVGHRDRVRPHSEWEAVVALLRSGLNDSAIARATGIPRETVREWRRHLGDGGADQVNSSPAGVVERQTRAPQKRVGESPCGFESHLRHDPRRSVPRRRRWSDAELAEAAKTHDWARRLPLNTILVLDSSYTSLRTLKRRLLSDGLLQPRCSECGLTEWRGARLALVLDHVNGNPRDHRLENLRLLCPNCNSQTATFAGRNKRRRRLASVDASGGGSDL
jgi:5-methylcytosine-specific restriction endonuclease McrA